MVTPVAKVACYHPAILLQKNFYDVFRGYKKKPVEWNVECWMFSLTVGIPHVKCKATQQRFSENSILSREKFNTILPFPNVWSVEGPVPREPV